MTAVIGGQETAEADEEVLLMRELAVQARQHRAEIAYKTIPTLPDELRELFDGPLRGTRTAKYLTEGSWKRAVRDMRTSEDTRVSGLALKLECWTPNALDN